MLLALEKKKSRYEEIRGSHFGLLIDLIVTTHLWSHLRTTEFTADGTYICVQRVNTSSSFLEVSNAS